MLYASLTWIREKQYEKTDVTIERDKSERRRYEVGSKQGVRTDTVVRPMFLFNIHE